MNFHKLKGLKQHILITHSFCGSGVWVWPSCILPGLVRTQSRCQLGSWSCLKLDIPFQAHVAVGTQVLLAVDWGPHPGVPKAGPIPWYASSKPTENPSHLKDPVLPLRAFFWWSQAHPWSPLSIPTHHQLICGLPYSRSILSPLLYLMAQK